MTIKIYKCDYPTSIAEISVEDLDYGVSPAQFCIVKKYELLYEKELERFKNIKGDAPYALPNVNRSIRVYKGMDREPQEYSQLNENGLFDTQEQAVSYLYHYLNQRWAEMGDFCVFEIYQ